MDRFIGCPTDKAVLSLTNLKSNMDRFIEYYIQLQQDNHQHLKSNMDRFIVISDWKYSNGTYTFKIQYG